MSATGKIGFEWGDGFHEFRLPIAQLLELQEKCDAGPGEIYGRLVGGTWRVQDLTETIRLGLVGGGQSPVEAMMLVRRYVHARPLQESVQPAQMILLASLVGVPDDEPETGTPEGKETGETTMPAGVSPQDVSTKPE